MSAEVPVMELTRNPVDGTWGFICRAHGLHRHGLVERHALNVERKHMREDHPDENPPLNLSALAADVLAAQRIASRSNVTEQQVMTWNAMAVAWQTLTGMTRRASLDYAKAIVDRELVAYVPTF